MALPEVIGEAIDLAAEPLWNWSPGRSMVLGEGIQVDAEETDSQLEKMEPCWRDAEVVTVSHSPTKPLDLPRWNSKAISSIPEV